MLPVWTFTPYDMNCIHIRADLMSAQELYWTDPAFLLPATGTLEAILARAPPLLLASVPSNLESDPDWATNAMPHINEAAVL